MVTVSGRDGHVVNAMMFHNFFQSSERPCGNTEVLYVITEAGRCRTIEGLGKIEHLPICDSCYPHSVHDTLKTYTKHPDAGICCEVIPDVGAVVHLRREFRGAGGHVTRRH